MNIAARFPIKENRILFFAVVLAHVGVFIVGFLLINSIWTFMLILVTISGSLYFSLRQYQAITNSPDDLCWSGEAWLMHDPSSEGIRYMDLLNTSWITPQICLLKFKCNEQEFTWFFSRKTLGERLYRELCYLSNSCIKNNQ